VEAARRYVDAMGGANGALQVARRAYDEGDYRWVAEVCKHLLFADDTNADARILQADALEQIGFGAENGTWRSAFLAGAQELRKGNFGTPISVPTDLLNALTVSQVFDSIAIRIDGPRAWDEHVTISWIITDTETTYLTELRNGALIHRPVAAPLPDSTTFTLTRQTLVGLVTGSLDLPGALANGTVTVAGDPTVLGRLTGMLATVDPDFAIVTP